MKFLALSSPFKTTFWKAHLDSITLSCICHATVPFDGLIEINDLTLTFKAKCF